MSRPNAKRTVEFLKTFFVNDLNHPNEPAMCKEDGQVSDNFFVNDLDHSNEPVECKGSRSSF